MNFLCLLFSLLVFSVESSAEDSEWITCLNHNRKDCYQLHQSDVNLVRRVSNHRVILHLARPRGKTKSPYPRDINFGISYYLNSYNVYTDSVSCDHEGLFFQKLECNPYDIGLEERGWFHQTLSYITSEPPKSSQNQQNIQEKGWATCRNYKNHCMEINMSRVHSFETSRDGKTVSLMMPYASDLEKNSHPWAGFYTVRGSYIKFIQLDLQTVSKKDGKTYHKVICPVEDFVQGKKCSPELVEELDNKRPQWECGV